MKNRHAPRGRKPEGKEGLSKLSRFAEFTGLMRNLALEGAEKYAGQCSGKENIDIVPEILGETGYQSFVLGDLIKRIIRFKNKQREDDLAKIALWTYLLWTRQFPARQKVKKNRNAARGKKQKRKLKPEPEASEKEEAEG